MEAFDFIEHILAGGQKLDMQKIHGIQHDVNRHLLTKQDFMNSADR